MPALTQNDFREKLLANLKKKEVKCDKPSVKLLLTCVFEELSKFPDNEVQLFINNGMHSARQRSTGE